MAPVAGAAVIVRARSLVALPFLAAHRATREALARWPLVAVAVAVLVRLVRTRPLAQVVQVARASLRTSREARLSTALVVEVEGTPLAVQPVARVRVLAPRRTELRGPQTRVVARVAATRVVVLLAVPVSSSSGTRSKGT